MAIQHDFSELAILVTGAGRGLGRSVSEKLAGCGATLGLIDVDGDSCSAVTAGIRAAGGNAFSYAVDVSDRAPFADAAARFARERGRIDAVVNNAMLLALRTDR
jgi:NAD(P)-dependent dehydrogenase (short-subunit alcohol dehydrogenase family)